MLDLSVDAGSLAGALIDIESVSGNEGVLADLVEQALRGYAGLAVERDGNVVLARTERRHALLVTLAGHLDTVPVVDNLPARDDGERLWGCGSADMKSGIAVALRLAHLIGSGAFMPSVDLSWVLYDCEEVEASRNGLGRLARLRPAVLSTDLAILLEPTSGIVEAGCQGTLRAVVTVTGQRAHSARSWLGSNAIHAAAPVLERLAGYDARSVEIDGLTYREGLNAVAINGGVTGNVVPDECAVTVNLRFAPDRNEAEARQHVVDVFAGYAVEVVDFAPAAAPGLAHPLTQAMVHSVGQAPAAKLGWTDVARYAELGIPAISFGPGDPNLAHTREEHVELSRIASAEHELRSFLGGPIGSAHGGDSARL